MENVNNSQSDSNLRIGKLGWTQTRVAMNVSLLVVVPLIITLLPTEESLHLKLSRLLLVKVINNL